ncbi:MAG: dynamin family protein [Pseudomonadota bacterium]
MNIETKIDAYTGRAAMVRPKVDLVARNLTALDPLARSRDALVQTLSDLIKVGDRTMVERARKLQTRLAELEPAITMIGQVKAGKTSLVNAMIGVPGLLPSDVNPWTSVVTSLHLNPQASAAQNSARFEFLDQMDWDRLVKGGGRIGELARRAGADSELQRVTQQVATLREKSRKRLGNKFEMLLGQDHDYGYFDGDLIERYVCLGDDFEDETDVSRGRGRFADITKAAHINMAHDGMPLRLCLRDTPGVNDTFLVREQITMKAIRGSQLCVVVLAAHQALSTVDIALMRLISNLKSRDVVIFVNRVDELPDPANQVPEIRESILETLKLHQGPENAEVIFGSAQWADHVLRNSLTALDPHSADALLNHTKAQVATLPEDLSDEEIIWHLSGLGPLQQAIAGRIAAGAGRTAMDAIARSARNLLGGIKITDMRAETAPTADGATIVDADLAKCDFATMAEDRIASLEAGLEGLHRDFTDRIARVHDSYLDRATAALIQHLETTREGTAWTYDPAGLRMLLRSSYRTYAKRSKDLISQVFAASAEDVSSFFERIAGLPDETYALTSPSPAAAPEPVILGTTIALDLQSNWWAKWWQRQSDAKSQSEKFRDLIAAETAPILEALRTDYSDVIRETATTQLSDMIADQRQVLDRMVQGDAPLADHGGRRAARMEVVDRALAVLDHIMGES